VDDPTWVGDPEDDDGLFLMVGSGKANLKPLSELLPPLKEVPTVLGDITVFL